jgi:hypothetical protein
VTYLFELDENHDIDGAVGGNDSKFINHSCDPNCEPDIRDGKIFITSIRDIAPGEELSYDYSFDFTEDNTPCKCGSPKCRGYIVAEDQLHLLKVPQTVIMAQTPGYPNCKVPALSVPCP